ncbi:uncharacterized protein N7443_006043 [Penicillium atrosanguineum]|uniref:uncharacterized protein n=1 Tax=Penicillium atrosanguineum TaxID=1132637 RepID=UPI0023914837|nr:uncharacterized protein N7443_006043 [Penicillium atrosanguineum]KAJ5301041.1 hypothetical protein N7443_006043 [Penicillium atrosanguineum]
MPNGISKRQQLRHEKALAELVRSVPGNDRCADCDAPSPGWASWNMGIFLCMRCGAIHRKLGTHISKVKSLSMDTWSAEQVDSMKSHGNLLMNKIYNPKNIKPPVPTDVDEADSSMERFIRQKYQYRSLENGKPKPPSRDDESYTRNREDRRERRREREYERERDSSPEGSPPPLPPKSGSGSGSGKWFGLRSSSSTSNLRRFGTKKSPALEQRPWSPPPPRKASGLGAPVADVTTDSFEAKMAALREMGFNNDRRNEMVLRGLNENLDKSIETLVRLGEGSGASSRSRTPAPASTTAPAARATTPNPPASASTNPFDRAVSNPVPQPQSASYNPFDQPTATTNVSAQPLESSFQNLQVSQPLFPHSTGGYPAQTGLMPQTQYQQPYTPPVTATFSQNPYVSSPQPMDNSYNPFFQTAPQQNGLGAQSYPNPSAPQNNPFFNNAQPQQQQQQAPQLSVPQPQHANTMPAFSSSSPFGTSPFGSSPFQSQPPQQQPQATGMGHGSYNPFQQSMGQTPQNAGGYPNQFQQQQQQQQQFQPQQQQYQQHQQFQQPQHLAPQLTGRMDKNSILSLYNLAPSQPTSIPSIPEQYQPQPTGTSPVPPLTNSLNSTPQTQPGSNITTPQPSNGMTTTASRNPFGAATVGSGLAAQAGVNYQQTPGLGIGMGTNAAQSQGLNMNMNPNMGMGLKPSAQGPPPSNAFPRMHISQPSVDINGLQNGRHSPDAFASLSARYG